MDPNVGLLGYSGIIQNNNLNNLRAIQMICNDSQEFQTRPYFYINRGFI